MVKKIVKKDAYAHPTSLAPMVEYLFEFDDGSVKEGGLTFWPGVTDEEIDFHLKQEYKREEKQRTAGRPDKADLSAHVGKTISP